MLRPATFYAEVMGTAEPNTFSIEMRVRTDPSPSPATNQNSSGVQHLLKDLIQVPILEFVDQYPQSAAFHDGLAGNHVPLPQPMIGDSILFSHDKNST